MKIVYVSRACNEKIYKRLKKKPSQAAVKFNRLLAEGLALNNKTIYCIGTEDSIQNEKIKIENDEKYKNLNYVILGKMNFFKKNITIIKKLYELIEHEDIVICDYLNIKNSFWALLVSKIKRSENICIITDFPEYLENIKEKGVKRYLYIKIAYSLIKKFKKYIFLTDEMNKKVNKNDKANIRIEGVVDKNMEERNTIYNYDKKEKNIVYAGGLYEEYGIKNLIKAFIKIDNKDIRLDLFGDGPLVNKILKYCDKDKRIRYHGVVPNDQVIEFEMEATLLINPRPSNKEFTKYSFPSKNIEYMVSGTPVLTTNLPGMPSEYHQYVYIINYESEEGIRDKIIEIVNKSPVELRNKGELAKKFVLDKKNNLVQSKRIIDMINEF